MKKFWKCSNSKVVRGLLVTACAIVFFMGQKSTCFAETTGKVTVDSAKVRQEANATSTVIGSSAQGSTVTITNEVTDSSGMVWYEVYVDANTKGYIRSDLVQKDGSSDSSTSESSQADSTAVAQTTTASGAESQPDAGMDAQYATISVEVAKIRSGASTDKSVVDSLPQNTSVIVSGQTDDPSNGKTWYYITFTGTNGAEKTGYVRSDLIELGDMVPVEEPQEEVVEQPVEEQQVAETEENKDYEVVYTTNENGEYEWYLYNNIEGNRQKLEEVLAAAHAQSINDSLDASMVSKQRIIIIIMIAVIIVLAVVMTIMIFKLRDAYYEEYEDDEEEDDDEEDEEEPIRRPVSRKVVQQAEPQRNVTGRSTTQRAAREEEPVRRSTAQADRPSARRSTMQEERQAAVPVKEVTYEEEPTVQTPVKSAPKRKAKNFLIDDDDFEFEFLNMNDKN